MEIEAKSPNKAAVEAFSNSARSFLQARAVPALHGAAGKYPQVMKGEEEGWEEGMIVAWAR